MHEPCTPEELLARIAADRDRGAFAELFVHFAPRLAGFYARGGLASDVREELVQEVMIRVWHRADQFDPHRASASTWLFTIARNVRIDHLRRPAVQAQIEPLDPAYVDPAADRVDDQLVRAQQAVDVRAAVDALPPEQAAILRAAYFQHKTLLAIAQESHLALGTVKSRVRLAFQRLRGALDKRP